MTSKAQWFRYFAERSGPKRPPAGVGRVERGAGSEDGARAPSAHAARRAGYALEVSRGRPSRKSTRASANRQKNDVQFRLKRRLSEGRADAPRRKVRP
jgi:hypothetical protein